MAALNADDFDPLGQGAKPAGRGSATTAPAAAKGLDAASFDPLAKHEPPKPASASSGEWLQSLGLGAAALAGGGAAARVPKIAKAVGEAYRGAPGAGGKILRGPQAILAPTSTSPEARGAEALIREKTGEGARETAQTMEPLKGMPKPAKPYDPRTWFQKTAWADVGGKSPNEQLAFIKYVEGRSQGATLADQSLKPLADKLRTAYDSVYARSQRMVGEGKKWAELGFIQDYYQHLWVRDAKHAELFSSPTTMPATGSGSFFKQRKIPTIEEGLAAGLTPKNMDPVQTTLEYIANANRYLTNIDILETALSKGLVQRRSGVKNLPPGWQKLNGALTERGLTNFYAPEGFAKVYNNYVSKGAQGEFRDLYKGAQFTANAMTAFELGLSGFHAGLMGFEGAVSEVARGIEHVFHGELGKAANAIGKAPFAGVHLARTGAKVEQAWLGRTQPTKQMREVVDLLTRAGGRGAGVEHTAGEYQFTAAGSFWEAFRRGSLRAEWAADKAMAKQGYGLGALKVFAKNMGRVLESAAEPLFKHYVPKIKNGAFYETMSAWLERNPTADMNQKTAAAREIWDSIDNRFGQVVQDNIFWNRALKQTCMLAMRSYSWNLGTVREIGGGLADISKTFSGDKFAPRAYYVMALPIVYGFMSALYQTLKTGQPPESLDDYMAPRTGGVDAPTGKPERRNVYGYMKDVYGWAAHPMDEATAKFGGAPHLAYQIATGKDSMGRPIAGPGDNLVNAYFRHVMQAMTPIAAKSLTGMRKGTNIGAGERMGLGFQPAGQRWTDPERWKAMEQRREMQGQKVKQRYERRQESYQK